MKIAITGATGLVGKKLGKKLFEMGHEIYVISRDQNKALTELAFPFQFSQSVIPEGVEAVINLAGENIGDGRWTEVKKKKIVESRIDATKKRILEAPNSVKVWVQASAVGIYGDQVLEHLSVDIKKYQEDLHFDDLRGKKTSFLQTVCHGWENAVSGLKPQTRVCIARIGMVLAHQEGALEKIILPVRMGLGAPLGGKQFSPWIHIDDLVSVLIEMTMNANYSGIYNCVAPEITNHKQQMQVLAKLFQRPLLPAVPGVVLRLALGEMAEILLSSQKVSAQKLIDHQFKFQYPRFSDAIKHLYSHEIAGEEFLYCEQYVSRSRTDVFPFFADARNLESITPEQLHFHIQKVSTEQIQKGTLIDYRLKIHGIPARWKTLISEWKENEVFVDEQLKGPYNLWHHTHEFHDRGRGTLMIDKVRYRLPLGFLGYFFAGYFVQQDVKKIFQFRKKTIIMKFNGSKND